MRRMLLSAVPLSALLAACGGSGSTPAATSADAAVSTLLVQAGVQCTPALPAPAVQACAGVAAGGACAVTRDDHTAAGTCHLDDGRMMCAPHDWDDHPMSSPALDACSGKVATDACAFTMGGMSLGGACVALPRGLLACMPSPTSIPALTTPCANAHAGDACTVSVTMGMMDRSFAGVCTATAGTTVLACLPPPPAPVQACTGLAIDATCSVTTGDHAYAGTCRALPVSGVVACLPPPPPPPPVVVACATLNAGDACTFTHDGQTISGVCRDAGVCRADASTTLACLPPPPPSPPRIAACAGQGAGATCTVTDEDGDVHSGMCRQLAGAGPMLCLHAPPPPPQAAIQACGTGQAGDACSFTWNTHTVNGACSAAPDGTLVCSPACR